jgi:transcription antitermination factor NusG
MKKTIRLDSFFHFSLFVIHSSFESGTPRAGMKRMPILPAEPAQFPESLFNDLSPFDTEGRLWHVLHTKPRQEKSLARQLHGGELPFYLPLIPRRTPSRGRMRTSFLPLFPGYCFVLVNDRERVRVLTTNRVVRSLEVSDQPKLWEDLRQVHRLIESGAPVTPEGRLVPGTLVEIRSGPLTGLKGIIIRNAKQRRFVVQVDFIQRGASVELEDYMLARAI